MYERIFQGSLIHCYVCSNAWLDMYTGTFNHSTGGDQKMSSIEYIHARLILWTYAEIYEGRSPWMFKYKWKGIFHIWSRFGSLAAKWILGTSNSRTPQPQLTETTSSTAATLISSWIRRAHVFDYRWFANYFKLPAWRSWPAQSRAHPSTRQSPNCQ